LTPSNNAGFRQTDAGSLTSILITFKIALHRAAYGNIDACAAKGLCAGKTESLCGPASPAAFGVHDEIL